MCYNSPCRAMHFPLFIDLEDKPCLVVGGGSVAMRKAAALSGFGARVVQISPETCGRTFADSDADGMALVVAATDDATVNAHVAALCKAKGIPVNVVDDPANCTFLFPAICRKGPMTVAVSSGGACPTAAKLVRDRASRLMPDDFVAEVERLGREREEMKKAFPNPDERRKKCEEALRRWND